MKILIDSSIWIDYFRGGSDSKILDQLIDDNLICTNNLILAEITPALKIRKQNKLIELMREIQKIPLNIDWNMIIEYQIQCLTNGINKVGIPDLIIVENAIKNDLILFSLDKHFHLISDQFELNLFRP